MNHIELNELRAAMGTLPSNVREINFQKKYERDEVSTKIVDTNANPFRSIFSTATATWGDNKYDDKWLIAKPIDKLKVIAAALTGRTLPQALENVNFTWRVRGVPRSTFNHHTEKAKLGCTFYSVGCRDNNKLDTDFILPDYIEENNFYEIFSEDKLISYYRQSKEIYSEMLDQTMGSWQSARAFLPLTYQHSYHFTQNLLSLIRMYKLTQNDKFLKLLYQTFMKSIEEFGYTLFYLAITKNFELKQLSNNDEFENLYACLSVKEKELLN